MRKSLPHTGSNFLYTSSCQHQVGKCQKVHTQHLVPEGKKITKPAFVKKKKQTKKKRKEEGKPDPTPDNHKNGLDVATCTTENMVNTGIKT